MKVINIKKLYVKNCMYYKCTTCIHGNSDDLEDYEICSECKIDAIDYYQE